MLTFAKVHGKPFQINEWGVWGPDAAPFVKAMAAFLKTNGARSHTYWNSNGGYPGELNQRDKEWPRTTQAFKAAFGKAKQLRSIPHMHHRIAPPRSPGL